MVCDEVRLMIVKKAMARRREKGNALARAAFLLCSPTHERL